MAILQKGDKPLDFSTPDLSPETLAFTDKFYPPSEDSYLLLDALEKDASLLTQTDPLLCLEVGSGSGIVSTFLARILGPYRIFLATDINNYACLATKYTAAHNACSVQVIRTDLVAGLRLCNRVDLLIFNPPYVVTEENEVGGRGIEASWAGGSDGRSVINRVLLQIPTILSARGIFYLLLIKQNKPEEIRSYLEGYGLSGELVVQRKAANEHLMVYRFQRKEYHNKH